VELEPGVNAWLVMGWKEICDVVRRDRVFSHDPNNWRDLREGNVAPDSGLGPMMFPRPNAYCTDGPDHHRLRVPLDDGIRGLDQRRFRRAVSRMCADLIADFAGRGEADLVAEYAAAIPMLAVASLFGLDVARGHELQRAIVSLFTATEESASGNRALERILTECLQSHRQAPTDDMTTVFLDHPNLRDDAEIMQSMLLMVGAGYETTTAWIAQALQLMLTDPRFRGRVGSWRPGVDDALDQVLWGEPPMANMPARYALSDTELAGQPIQRGDAIILGLMAAGSDPGVHVADSWTELGNRSHLAWSTGPHACPAQVPARIITRTAVDTALSLLPGMKLAVPAEQLTVRPSPWTRCPLTLPVRFTPFTPQSAPGSAPPTRELTPYGGQ
jgi:cytochrome P450